MTVLETQGLAARYAARALAVAGTARKNAALEAAARAIEARQGEILAANAADLEAARAAGLRPALLDRLALDEGRIAGIVEGVRQVAALPDPIGAVTKMDTRPNGLTIGKRRVPLGVIGIIYEARPNVTVDAAALCLKSGNAALLRGGKEAHRSAAAIVAALKEGLAAAGLPEDALQLVEDTSRASANELMTASGYVALVADTSRESANELMGLTEYLDVLIPRGGAGLIRSVVENARVPVIQTGVGVCHIYVHERADLDMAARILHNAKTSRPSVCNAAEGVLVDRGALVQFGEMLSERIGQVQARIYDLAGEETFNINSTQQLGQVLFERLGLPPVKKTKTGWSTNAEVLEKLRGQHPIIEEILEYRQLTKLKSTYADGLGKVIAPDGRIHTSFQNTVTATGRLSSTEPNLQNIPVRTELGAELRKMFVAPAGKVLVDADYSQIELRLLAHMAGDEAMIAAFRSGGDFHAETAAKVFHVAPDQVTHEMRRQAKAVNFGIVYGISAFSLSQDIGVSVAEAKAYMEAYFATFPGVRTYMDAIVERAREQGYVETLFHRRRDLPELKSSNFNLRSFGERVALNMPIQGTAADIMKLAMVAVRKRLRQELPEARLVLQVHDELIVECPEAQAETAAALLKEEMENVVSLSVPLTADAHWGRNWLEAKG